MPWFLLIAAGIFEVAFATCLKLSDNFSNLKWVAGFLVCSVLSFMLLSKAIQSIPMGTAYAIWTGIGAVGIVLVGIFFHDEPAGFWRLFFIFTLVASVIGLKLVSS